MALPILLMILALIVLMGQAACWKLRTEMVARHVADRALPPRTTATDPAPSNWRVASAQIDVNVDAGVTISTGDRFGQHPVIRGPALPLVTGDQWPVDGAVLSARDIPITGRATLDHPTAMFRRLGFRNRMDAMSGWLSDFARFEENSLPSNHTRRSQRLYKFQIPPL